MKKLDASSCWREGTLVQPVGTARGSTKVTQTPRMISNSDSGIFPEELKAETQRHLHLQVRSSATHDGQRQKPPCHGHHCVLGTLQYCLASERVGVRHTYSLEEP